MLRNWPENVKDILLLLELPEFSTTGFSRHSLYFAENKYSGMSFLTLKEISKKKNFNHPRAHIGNNGFRNKSFNTVIVYDNRKLI